MILGIDPKIDYAFKQWRFGTIHFCERLLNRAETPTSQLAALPLDALTRLAAELQDEALKRQ